MNKRTFLTWAQFVVFAVMVALIVASGSIAMTILSGSKVIEGLIFIAINTGCLIWNWKTWKQLEQDLKKLDQK